MGSVTHRDDSWIGRRVAEYRRSRGWTLAVLAQKVGLSSTQLSRIESGARQPSVGTLIEIAHAFGVSLSELVDEQYKQPFQVTRIASRKPQLTANGQFSVLTGDFPALQALHLVISPGADAPAAQHTGEEWIYVLDGRIDISIGENTNSLSVGDAVHFPSGDSHRVCNTTDRPSEILLVSTPAS